MDFSENHYQKLPLVLLEAELFLLSFIISIILFFDVKNNGGICSHIISTLLMLKVFKFLLLSRLINLSVIFLFIITGVGFLIHVYSTSYMHEEPTEHFGRYFSYLNLFVFSMLLLVLGANYVIMFIGWEGVGLCSYLLIGYWFKNTVIIMQPKKLL